MIYWGTIVYIKEQSKKKKSLQNASQQVYFKRYYSKRINELENKSIWKDLASSCFKQL